MDHKKKHTLCKNTPHRTRKSTRLIRWISLLCLTALCLMAFVGCTEHVPLEDFEKLEKDFSNVSEKLASALKEIELLKDSNEAANGEIEALKGSNDAANEEIEDLKASESAAKQEIEALKASGAAAEAEIEALNTLIDTANGEIEALKASGAAAEAEIEALNTLIDTANGEIETLKASGAAAEAEIEALKEELNELKDIIAQLPIEPEEEKIRIYIDQGHNPTGNHNAGATGNGLYEENITYAMGILLAELLEADGRFEFILSRPTESTVLGTDTTSSLEARVNGAIEFDADYLVSIHINAFTSDSAHGIEVLVAEDSGTSYDFGSALLAGMVESTGLRDRGMKLRPELYILKNAPMPAVLLEMGFITNPTDSALLVESPELFVEGIYNGLLNYFNLAPVTSAD